MASSDRSAAAGRGLSKAERAAVSQAATEARKTKAGKDTEQDVLDAIAAMGDSDRAIAEGLHALVKRVAPELVPRTWYGFPAYAKNGKVVLFWQYAGKFSTRYGHVGFQDIAQLDDGTMWPTAFAVTEWTPENEQALETLIRRAVGE
ncbi:MAG: hypothetical protein M9891_00705 [Austwickia sp.]|nr:hypothetical protein [Austwickia sp.]MCO5307810.1 hypothetical protein [Austwickia sp.]